MDTPTTWGQCFTPSLFYNTERRILKKKIHDNNVITLKVSEKL